MSITDIGQSQAEQTGGYEQFDVSGLPFVKTHPTTAVAGEPVAVRYFPGDNDPDRGYIGVVVDDPHLYVEDNGELVRNDPDGDQDGQQIVESTDETGDDYKVVNTQDSATRVLDSGVDFDGNIFYGDAVDEFDVDRAVFKFGGGSGRSISSVLDAKGAGSADIERTGVEWVDAELVRNDSVYQPIISEFVSESDTLDEDSEMDEIETAMNEADELPVNQFDLNDDGWPINNRVLIERDPRRIEETEMPRYQRDTILRPDLEGEAVAFLVQRLSDVRPDYNGDAYWTTVLDLDGVLLDQDGEPSDAVDWDRYLEDEQADSTAELEAPLSVPPTDAFEIDDAVMAQQYNGYLEWHYPNEETLDAVRTDNGFETVSEATSDDTGTVEAE